jgi:succinate-semialdehyde dehydrogenase/glutarate-semialdehyde dehydrogenase
MRKAADLLRDRADAITPLLTMEQGKPLPEAKGGVGRRGRDRLVRRGGAAPMAALFGALRGRLSACGEGAGGPVAAFTPWNFPINQVVRELARRRRWRRAARSS